jgi:hypothetical protein
MIRYGSPKGTATRCAPGRRSWKSEGRGGTLIFFDQINVMVYAMAPLKGDNLNGYQSKDPPSWWRESEADLRATLDEGGRHHSSTLLIGGRRMHQGFRDN